MSTFGIFPIQKSRIEAPRYAARVRPSLKPIAGIYPNGFGQMVDTQGRSLTLRGAVSAIERNTELGKAIYTGASGTAHVDLKQAASGGFSVVGIFKRTSTSAQTWTVLHNVSTSAPSNDYLEVGCPSGGSSNLRFRQERSGTAISATVIGPNTQATWVYFVGVFDGATIRGYTRNVGYKETNYATASGSLTSLANLSRVSFGGWNYHNTNAPFQVSANGDLFLTQWLNVVLSDSEARRMVEAPFDFLFEQETSSILVKDLAIVGTPDSVTSDPTLSSVVGSQNYVNSVVSGLASSTALSGVIGFQDYIGAVDGCDVSAQLSTVLGVQAYFGETADLASYPSLSNAVGAQNHNGYVGGPDPSIGLVSSTTLSSVTADIQFTGTGTVDDLTSSSSLSSVTIIVHSEVAVSAATALPDSRLKDIPVLDPSGKNSKHVADRVREAVGTLLGNRGDRLDRAVTYRDGIKMGMFSANGGKFTGSNPGTVITWPPGPGPGTPEPEVPTPPTPTGLEVTAGISHIYITHDVATYYGHAGTVVYGAKWPASDPTPPTFSEAVKLFTFQGDIASYSSDPATRWCIWIKWINRNDVESVAPAGGTNGAQVTTGQDVALLLDALSAAAQDPNSPYSKISFRADMFYIGPAFDYAQEDEPPLPLLVGDLWQVPSTGLIYSWSGTAWDDFNMRLPFIVNTRPTTINDMVIPAGVYMDAAFIYDLTASIARLGDAWIDNAMIAELQADKITGGQMRIGSFIESTGYSTPENLALPEEYRAGWRINASGEASFYQMTVRGAIYAGYGRIGGAQIGTTFVQSTNWDPGVSGWKLDNETGTLAGATVLIAKNMEPGDEANMRYFDTDAVGASSVLRIGNEINITADGDVSLAGNVDIGGTVVLEGDINIGGDVHINGTVNIADKVLIDAEGNATFAGKLTADSIDAVTTLNIAGNAVTMHEAVTYISEEHASSFEVTMSCTMDYAGEVTFFGFTQAYGMIDITTKVGHSVRYVSGPSGTTYKKSSGVSGPVSNSTGMIQVSTDRAGTVSIAFKVSLSAIPDYFIFGYPPRQGEITIMMLRKYR